MAADAIIGISLVWLSRRSDVFYGKREKRTRLFQSKVLEARGVNALEVAPVGVCARAMWGATASANDTRKTMGAMGIRKEKSTGDLGGGRSRGWPVGWLARLMAFMSQPRYSRLGLPRGSIGIKVLRHCVHCDPISRWVTPWPR